LRTHVAETEKAKNLREIGRQLGQIKVTRPKK